MATSNPATSAVSVPSRETYAASLIKRAQSDPAALRTLLSEASQSLGYVDFLSAFATRSKTTLAALASRLSDDDVKWLKRNLPKDAPQRAAIIGALRSVSATPKVELFPIGTRTFKDGSTNSKPQLKISVSGAGRFWEVHESAWWAAFLAIVDSPDAIAVVRQFCADSAIADDDSES